MNRTFTDLGSHSIGINKTEFVTIAGKISLPTIGEGASGNSQVVVNIDVNGGSPFYTGNAGDEGFQTGYSATAGDTVHIVLTSAAAVDQGLNLIKTTVSVYGGQ